jgi:hypothetical protein
VKSTGKADTPKMKHPFIVIDDPIDPKKAISDIEIEKAKQYMSEVFGARIEPKPKSISAAPIRSRGKLLKPEPEKPPRKYKMGETVATKSLPFTNVIICGYEWGGNTKHVNRDVWAYFVRAVGTHSGSELTLIAEDQIIDRIST